MTFISVVLSAIFGFIFLCMSLPNRSLVIASAAVNTVHIVASVNDVCFLPQILPTTLPFLETIIM